MRVHSRGPYVAAPSLCAGERCLTHRLFLRWLGALRCWDDQRALKAVWHELPIFPPLAASARALFIREWRIQGVRRL